MERHRLDRVRAGLGLPDHRVPPELPQLVHVAHEPRYPVVAGHVLEPMDHALEELGDVLHGPPGGGVRGVDEGLEIAGVFHQKCVQDAPSRVSPGQRLARREVG